MRARSFVGLSLAVAAAACSLVSAQTHKVEKPDSVVRAVGVFEWTGDLARPTASRLVPVSVFIDRQLQDAGVYLARPIPLALENGNVFELQKAGVAQGTLELAFARHLQTAEQSRMDEGWFAYGAVKPRPAEAAGPAKKSGPLPVVVASGGTRPHFSDQPESSSQSSAGTHTDRSTAAGAGTTVSAGPASRTGDPDQPAMHQRSNDDDSDSARNNPERPTLKKRTPAQAKAQQQKNETASVVAGGNLNDDPDRPNLHRGKPTSRLEDDDLPPLRGIPSEMHQIVAVSDPKDRPEHDFMRPWDSPEERASVVGHLRNTAAALLASYDGKMNSAPAPPPVKSRPLRRTAAQSSPAAPAGPADPFDPASEAVNAYTLSYGGAATFVFAARTAEQNPRFVTLVAQREPDGSLKTALSSVTDASHLDRTPQLRLVDAVDPDASNRASLLFELRGRTTREFALYRVIGASAEQTLVAGPPVQ